MPLQHQGREAEAQETTEDRGDQPQQPPGSRQGRGFRKNLLELCSKLHLACGPPAGGLAGTLGTGEKWRGNTTFLVCGFSCPTRSQTSLTRLR